jgi:hypothetical protein
MCSMLFKASNHSCSTLLRLALAAHRDLVGISPNPARTGGVTAPFQAAGSLQCPAKYQTRSHRSGVRISVRREESLL